jgi:hypothetical protein
MNPNAIIEVSWTNKIDDELDKFALQVNRFRSEHGAIKVGYLIKFIPLKNDELSTEENPNRPVVGYDVYRMEAGEEHLFQVPRCSNGVMTRIIRRI